MSSTFLKISVWAYNLKVNNIVRSKYIFAENNKIEILFSNYIYLDLLSKIHLQNNLIYKKLDKMLKPINRQLKFIKEDKRFFVTLNHLN